MSDQKAVDAASDQLAVAKQALQQATIASPISGKVVAVDIAVGDTVTAASTTAKIVIAGTTGYEAVTMVKVTDLPNVHVGDQAAVTIDGTTTPIAGQVARIGLVSTSGTTGTTYPVTIALAGDTAALRDGAVGTVTITTASVTQALAVPSSAVHVNNGRATVTLLQGGSTKSVAVQIGAVGTTWTQIKSGLTAGQTVVVADLSQALPGTATSSSSSSTQQTNPFGGRAASFAPRD
jgi:HlyD family secretion protein